MGVFILALFAMSGIGRHGVPDAVRHSSCRSAEPGPYQAPAFVTAPALQRTASQELRHRGSRTRVNALLALLVGHKINHHLPIARTASMVMSMATNCSRTRSRISRCERSGE